MAGRCLSLSLCPLCLCAFLCPKATLLYVFSAVVLCCWCGSFHHSPIHCVVFRDGSTHSHARDVDLLSPLAFSRTGKRPLGDIEEG